MPMLHNAKKILQETFGLQDFREGQKLIIESVLKQRDTLGIMPTGGGKSLCYQLPSLCFKGLTIVISPLISLMKDQLDYLHEKKIPAEMINSTVPYNRQMYIKEGVERGEIKLLYLTPERFKNEKFLQWLADMTISCFVIDEAHCISEWGHDFRPEYRKLKDVIKTLGKPPILALTATATNTVSQDIVASLNMRKPNIFISGFNRKNLIYGVQHHYSKEEKNKALLAFIVKVNSPGIVYTSSKKDAQFVYNFLKTNTKKRIGIYHGSLMNNVRKTMQDDFLQNRLDILVATNAFGMGVNKKDIRFVVHYSIPGSIEAYYQETGRAGRDGKTGFCLLLYMEQDERIQKFFIKSSNPPLEDLLEILTLLKNECKKGTVYTNELEPLMVSNKFNNFNLHIIIKKLSSMGLIDFEYNTNEKIEIDIKKIKMNAEDKEFLDELFLTPIENKRFLAISLDTLIKRMEYPAKDLKEKLDELQQKKLITYYVRKKGQIITIIKDAVPKKIQKQYQEKRQKKIAVDTAQFQAMVDYANLDEQCRRKFLLQYFHEEYKETNCKTCDICRGTYKNTRELEWNSIQKSIVIFFIHHSDKIGKTKTLHILKGSREIEAKYKNWDEYGMLNKQDIRDIESEINYLLKLKILEIAPGKYAVIKLSNYGIKKIKEIQ